MPTAEKGKNMPLTELPFPPVKPAAGCVGVKTPYGFKPCGKVPAPGSALCPKCQLLTEYHADAPKRTAEKTRRTLADNKAKEAALASSPLRAVNPKFGPAPVPRWGGGYKEDHARRSTKSVEGKLQTVRTGTHQ